MTQTEDKTRQPGLYRSEYEHDACGIGAIAHLKGVRSHQTLDDALSVLVNLEHRGGKGLERNTGDGAGVLFQIPHRFFRKEAQKEGQLLPDEGDYGVAMLFFPHDDAQGVADAKRVFEEGCAANGVPLLFWREVPVDPHDLGDSARACMPTILQAFLRRPEACPRGIDFERKLYVTRRTIERAADKNPALANKIFYVCSMSSRTIVYKGMLVATQMRRFFIDLNDAAVETSTPGVYLLDCEPHIPNPVDILASRRFKSLVAQMREEFGYVVIDTPPLSAFVDGAVISQNVDGMLLVVRRNFTKRDEILGAYEQLKKAGANVLGTVLNFCEDEKSEYYYSYYNKDGKRVRKSSSSSQGAPKLPDAPLSQQVVHPSAPASAPVAAPAPAVTGLKPLPNTSASPDSTMAFLKQSGYQPRTDFDE